MCEMNLTPIERFVSKLAFNPISGCVVWMGALSYGGQKRNPLPYGSFYYRGKVVRAHLWAAEHIHRIDRSGGLHVDHSCRYSLCVHHLRAATDRKSVV